MFEIYMRAAHPPSSPLPPSNDHRHVPLVDKPRVVIFPLVVGILQLDLPRTAIQYNLKRLQDARMGIR